LGRQAAILGHDGPAIGQVADLAPAGVDHRLDREDHAFDEVDAGAGPAVMQYAGIFVELPSNAMAAELAHHREAVALGVTLDDVADVTEMRARADPLDAQPHAFEGDLAQAASGDRRLADAIHAAGIAVEAVLDDGDVDVEDVAGLEHLVAGNAVADLVVDGGADRLRERAVARWGIVE